MPLVVDHPSINSHGTPKRAIHRHDTFLSSQGFKVAYQKVNIEIDLEENVVFGVTELTVMPLDPSLKQVKLDSRGTQIESVTINDRSCRFDYTDFFQNDEYLNDSENPALRSYPYNERYDTHSETTSIEQHHQYRGKFHPLYTDQNNSQDPLNTQIQNSNELTIYLPDGLKLRLQDANSKQTFSPATSKTHNTNTPIATNTLLNSERVYTPLQLKITYKIVNAKNGITFYGGKHTNVPKNRWVCYTNNGDLGCSASSWVPCVDNLYEKPVWDISITVPKTIGDIGETKIIGTKEAERALKRMHQLSFPEDDDDNNDNEHFEAESDNGDNDLDESVPLVVAVPDLASFKETPHTIDIGKKVINFQFYNPIAPHHLGFAVGAFEKMPFMEVKSGSKELVIGTNNFGLSEEDQNDPASLVESISANKIPTMIYYLPGRKGEIINTTAFLYKVLEFYSKEFGSFPFNSYSMVFLNDIPCNSYGFAGMSIVSESLLYGPDIIEPMFEVTEQLSVAMATQYFGINVLPKTFNDLWCTIGLANFMAGQFMKKFFGLNHYKFKIKERCDLLCDIDVGRRPLANQYLRFPLNIEEDCSFLTLKAPLVLFILDRRMTKTDKSFGLSRVIPKLFLQAMSNDLYNGNCLSTQHFQHVCEKVAHHKLEGFFQNWVHRSGAPILRVTQKFNKKRMFVEMSIRQVQNMESGKPNGEDKQGTEMNTQYREGIRRKYQRDNFLDDASMTLLQGEDVSKTQNVFTGPMTIRIHEADGTPYEHIVDIQEGYTKLDIQYNTKYKRIRRQKKDEDQSNANIKSEKEENKVNRLGDVLSTSKEIDAWELVTDERNDEENNSLSNDAFEWIRVDADFEWICKMYINQADSMFESQLCQDRDVEAQLESIKFFSDSLRPNTYYATILLRTVMDRRYFYGLRTEALKGLAKISKEENGHIGLKYLLKAYKNLFCYNGNITKGYKVLEPNEYLPLPNDFSNFENLFLLEAFPHALALIKNQNGKPPLEVKELLLNMLKYNDNTSNDFSDCFYQKTLIKALSTVILNSGLAIENHNFSAMDKDEEFDATGLDKETAFMKEAVLEMNRAVKLDQWLESYHHVVSESVLQEKIDLAVHSLTTVTFEELLEFTKPVYHQNVRLTAFEGLLILGGLKNKSILSLFFMVAKLDPSPYIRLRMIKSFCKAVGIAAVEGTHSYLDDDEFLMGKKGDESKVNSAGDANAFVGNTMVIVDDMGSAGSMESRRDQIARSTIKGAIDVLRRDYGIGKGLRKELWEALHSPLLSIHAKRDLFDIVTLLYGAVNSMIVSIKAPSEKKIVAKVEKSIAPHDESSGSMIIGFKREGRLKIQLGSLKVKTKNKISLPKVEDTNAAKPILKIKKLDFAPKDSFKEIAPMSPITIKKEPANNILLIPNAAKKFEVTFKYKKPSTSNSVLEHSPSKTTSLHLYGIRKVQSQVVRSSPEAGLRYVKLDIFNKFVTVSSDPFESTSNRKSSISSAAQPNGLLEHTLPVTLKLPAIKLASATSKKRKDGFEDTETKKKKTIISLKPTGTKSVKTEVASSSSSDSGTNSNVPSAIPKIKLKLK